MKTIYLVILTMSMAACGDSIFRSRPESSNLIGRTETTGNAVDAADSGSSSNVDSASDAKAKQLSELDPAAVAAAEKCPGLDPVLIDKLIKSGQPFEVECEVEVEVGPDMD